MNFTKLKIIENLSNGHYRYDIPYEAKVGFGKRGIIIDHFTEEQIENVFEFSYHQGKYLNQKEGWDESDSTEQRKSYQMWLDTFSGKIGEEADVYYLSEKLKLDNSGVDYSITGKNDGDMGDIMLTNNRLIGSRTTSHYSNLLLLEKSKSFAKCSSTILNRLMVTKRGMQGNTLESIIPKNMRTNDFCDSHKKELKSFIMSKDIKFSVDIVGKIYKHEYMELDKIGHIIRRNDYFKFTKIKTTNRYVCSGDLWEITKTRRTK